MASGWDFSGIPNLETWSRGFGIGIFYFGVDREIPKVPKFQGKNFRFLRFPDYRDFFGIFWKSPGFSANPRGFGIFLNFGILIPGILQNPRDSIFFGIFYLRDIQMGIFFRGLGYPDLKPTLIRMKLFIPSFPKNYFFLFIWYIL